MVYRYPVSHLYFLGIHRNILVYEECCITILYCALENTVANTFSVMYGGAGWEGWEWQPSIIIGKSY